MGVAIWCSKRETFSVADKKRWAFLKNELALAKAETRELVDGYAFRLEGEKAQITDLAEWVAYESRCCLFFNFEISLLRNQGPLWLKVWGSEGAKQYVSNLTIMRSPVRTAENHGATVAQALPGSGSICCDTGAMNRAQQERYRDLNSRVHGASLETRKLPDGYAHRLRAGSVPLPELAEWVLLERLCCPFLDFGIEVEHSTGPVWVKLQGIPAEIAAPVMS